MLSDFSKKRNNDFSRKKIFFQMGGILLLVIIIILIIADFKIHQKKLQMVSEINFYEKQIENLKKSNATIQEEIKNSDNKDYLEKVAYEQLNQQKPGEQEFIFVSQSAKSNEPGNVQNFWSFQSWFGWLSSSWSWIKSRL